MPDMDGLFDKVAVVGGVNIHKFLRIVVDEGEPRALNLDHQPVAFFEDVGDIGDGPFYLLYLAWLEGYRFLIAFAEAAAHDLAVDEHLVAAHRVVGAVIMTTYRHGAFL